jgi:hypothetical protein
MVMVKVMEMIQEQDERNTIRLEHLGNVQKQMAAMTKMKPMVTLEDTKLTADPTPMVRSATMTSGLLLKVLATTMPPLTLAFLRKLAAFDSWKASWEACLQTLRVASIANKGGQTQQGLVLARTGV